MVQVSVEMPADLKGAIEMEAEQTGFTGMSEFIRQAAREKVGANGVRRYQMETVEDDVKSGGE